MGALDHLSNIFDCSGGRTRSHYKKRKQLQILTLFGSDLPNVEIFWSSAAYGRTGGILTSTAVEPTVVTRRYHHRTVSVEAEMTELALDW